MLIKTLNFATNFELSTLGATGIVRILIDIGLKTDCRKAASYADVNSKVPNLGFFGLPILEKLSENRRIFIRLTPGGKAFTESRVRKVDTSHQS